MRRPGQTPALPQRGAHHNAVHLAGKLSQAARSTSEYADAVSIPDELESLQLELRDPEGMIVPTDWIAVQDTEYLLGLARQETDPFDDDPDEPLDSELAQAIEHDAELIEARFREVDAELADCDDPERWQPSPVFARYQVLVMRDESLLLSEPFP